MLLQGVAPERNVLLVNGHVFLPEAEPGGSLITIATRASPATSRAAPQCYAMVPWSPPLIAVLFWYDSCRYVPAKATRTAGLTGAWARRTISFRAAAGG